MELKAFEKIIMTFPVERPKNGLVIGIRPERDESVSYFIEPRSIHFGPLRNKQRVIMINSKEINKTVKIEKHII